MADFIIGVLNIVMVLGSLFLICIILIQRGKGGGLAGAFGGVGGSSAFGTKAGDIFTKITICVAIGWIIAAMLLVVLTNRQNRSDFSDDAPTSQTKELGSSSSKSKPSSTLPDLGTGDLPPAIPSPAKGVPLPSPSLDLPPAMPDVPVTTPTPSTPAPAPGKTPSTPK